VRVVFLLRPSFCNLLHHPIQRPLLHHQRHNLKQGVRSRHSRKFSIRIVRGRDLDDIGRDEVDAFEAADDGSQFAGGPAAGFGRAGCGCDY